MLVLNSSMIPHIRGFKLDTRKNNNTHYGYLFYRYVKLPFASKKYQTRVVRIWVPKNFDINKKYGVLYMSDGQNAVDENLSAYGEWDMEDHFKKLEKEGYPQFIIVGIDCPKNSKERTLEYLPGPCSTFHYSYLKRYHGNLFADYVANELVPFINERINVDYDRVGFCGSSMGGLISFYICSKYPEIFKFCISFSPAFFFFSKKHIREQFYSPDWTKPCNKYVFFIGGGDDLERHLRPNTDYMVSLLKENGFDDSNLLYMIDETRIHHESTWSDFVEPALRFTIK